MNQELGTIGLQKRNRFYEIVSGRGPTVFVCGLGLESDLG